MQDMSHEFMLQMRLCINLADGIVPTAATIPAPTAQAQDSTQAQSLQHNT